MKHFGIYNYNMDVKFEFIFLIIGMKFIGTVVCACPSTVHMDVKGFGPDCKYRCNCKNNDQCDENGHCKHGCLYGWMGPACQYLNHALTSKQVWQNGNSYNPAHSVDGDVGSCSMTIATASSGQLLWRVELNYKLYITGLVLNISDSGTEKYRGFTIEIGNGTDAKDLCYHHGTASYGIWGMTIYCERGIIGNVVEIKLAKNVDRLILCEVEIFGGRHLSFNKYTLPKETLEWHGFWNSSYAVDGRQMRQGEKQDDESERTCMATIQTTQMKTHQWSVNLDTEYLIQGIHFFGRYGQLVQFNSYEIYVHGLNTSSREPVFTDNLAGNDIGDYNPKSVNFTNPVFGLEVQVQRRNADILVICEVEVFGECPLGKCGWDCEKMCMCKSQTTGFAKIEGWCPYGCKGRWSGHNGTCNIECSNTQWGSECNKTCGKCKNNDYCNASDGACPNSCEPGWIPPLCIQECNNNTYGDDCNFTCGYCKHDLACNKQNGECTDGCSPGYKQPLCNQECDPLWYGKNCSESCGKCHGGDSCDQVTGYCPADCDAGYKGQDCQSIIDTKEPDDARSPTGIIVGAVIAVSIILIIILACFIYKYKSNRNAGMSDKRTQPMLINETIEVNDEIVTSKKKNGEAKQVAQNQPDELGAGKKEKKESATKLSSFRTYSKKVKSEPTKLYDEFNELPYGLKHDASEAEAVEHKPKNRYKDMYPYNANRVILPKIEEKPESTYINASYIDGYHFPRKYIAAQGALKTTVNDMWRMMWSQDANVIIMLTNCIEIGKIKCVQYWPESGTETYGDIQVELVSVEEYSDFKIRMFLATEIDSGEHRSIVQFHYTAWPDKSVPDSALSLVQFWRKVRGHEKADKFPWVVHCSAGVGRTGTFIALDYLYDQGKSKNVVDVKDCVNTLRKQRLNMVQTKEQYLYLCEAGAESLTPIGTVHRKDEFLAICTELISETGSDALRAEFDSINDDTDIDTETVEALYNNTQDPVDLSAFLEENKPKSRDITIVPDDLHRPVLTLAVKCRNDFINSVFVSTYRKKDRVILTQFPLKDTVVDFVRMVWELDIKTLVLLEDTVTAEGVYWPTTEVPMAISPFKVILLNDVRHEYCTIRTIRYSFLQNDNEQLKDVKMFHFRAWPSFEKTPESTSSFIQLMSEIERIDEKSSPLVIQCLDGAAKSGLLCLVLSVLERMKTDCDIAIAETLRMIRLRRKQMIGNFEQYKFCYEIVRSYIETHDANVL